MRLLLLGRRAGFADRCRKLPQPLDKPVATCCLNSSHISLYCKILSPISGLASRTLRIRTGECWGKNAGCSNARRCSTAAPHSVRSSALPRCPRQMPDRLTPNHPAIEQPTADCLRQPFTPSVTRDPNGHSTEVDFLCSRGLLPTSAGRGWIMLWTCCSSSALRVVQRDVLGLGLFVLLLRTGIERVGRSAECSVRLHRGAWS